MKVRNIAIITSILLLLAFGGCIFEIIKINHAQSYISTLQTQLTKDDSQISSLQSIVNLSQSQTIVNNYSVSGTAGQLVNIASFTAVYPGYIHITGTSTTTNGYLLVNSTTLQFGTGTVLDLPILPGNVTISFGNSNFINGATANLTVNYIY